ncbi:MAG: head GIN domain-containing protein [Leeuwenhoekiella sp.]
MKYYLVLLPFFISVFISCDSDKGLNCFQSAGDKVEVEYDLDSFEAIVVEERIQLLLKDGPQQRVLLKTGENLVNDIEITVTDGVLTLYNDNGCNVVRDYNITQVEVTSPNISQIRNASGYEIQSLNTLSWPKLELLSEDVSEEDGFHKDGDFRLALDVQELTIIANGLSNFFLSGAAENADITLLEGDMRFDGRNLTIQELDIFHRGTNKVIINPQQVLRGKVLSTGNLISVNRPPLVEVEETYTGRLIFQ